MEIAMGREPERCRRTLMYPRDLCDPKDWLRFVQLDPFPPSWKRLGLDDIDDLAALEVAIMAWPERPPVISGTGGLRKLRFAPVAWSTGKRGAARVYYVSFAANGLVALVYAHDKARMDTISTAQKGVIRRLIREIQDFLDSPRRR
jgi:hypothetical protein